MFVWNSKNILNIYTVYEKNSNKIVHLLKEPTHMQLKIPEKDAATENIVEKKIFNKNQQIFHVWDNLATRQ